MIHTAYLLWLFPLLFAVHELEEALVVKRWAWTHRNSSKLRRETFIKNERLQHISQAGFSLIVSEETALILLLTAISAHFHLYAMFCGLLLANSVHLLFHVGELLYYRQYVPGCITALLTLPPSIYIYNYIATHGLRSSLWADLFHGSATTYWGVTLGLFLILNLSLMYAVVYKWSRRRAKHINA